MKVEIGQTYKIKQMNTLVKKKAIVKKSVVKTPTHFHLRVLSRHPSVSQIRGKILIPKIKAVYRHGSTTQGDFKYEINSVQSIKNSADKLLMKQCFDKAGVSHAKWKKLEQLNNKAACDTFLKEVGFPETHLIIKSRFGSRGRGNTYIKTRGELDSFLKAHLSSLNNYIVEEYKSYLQEYRIHVSKDGCFYTCKKALKKDTPKAERFQRHDENCVWLIESNPNFNKPSNWNAIINDCKKALAALGGDAFGFDVKTTSPQNSKEKDKSVKWILIESASAPSFAEGTTKMYIENLPKIIKSKYGI